MSNYTKTTDFAVKDTLNTGDPDKIIRGSEFEAEFDAISTAIATKSDTAGPTFTGTLTFETISDGTINVTAFVDEDDMSSDSATLVPTQQSVKAYVDSQVTAQDLDVTSDSGTIAIDLDSEVMTIAGGEGIDTSATGNTVTIAGEDASTSNKGIASFDSADFSVTSGEVHLVTSAAAFGAVGDGTTDDTAALQTAMDSVAVSGAWLDGGNKTYLITTTIDVDQGAFCRMRNFKFKLGTSYSDQGRFNCDAGSGTTAMTVALENIVIDGGRGSYKTSDEPWTVETEDFFGYDSIKPSLSAIILVNAFNENTNVHVTNCRFENIHALAAIRVKSYGTTIIQGCIFKNISFKSFEGFQSPDEGVTQKGRTIVSDVYAEDVGLLPDTFTVDGGSMSFATTTASPQGSFNFICSFGDYSISNAVVKNYGSTGVCGDRNTIFNASNITITNDSDRSFSNNPSGAFWIEGCEESNVTNLTVDVTARATIDTTSLDNSLLQIYLTNGNKAFFNNVFLKTDASTAYVNKFIRGSIKDTVHCNIENFYIEGTCRNLDDGVSFLMLPNSTIGHDIRLAHGYIDRGDIKIEQPFNVTIDDVYLKATGGNGDVLLPVASNAGITGTVESASIVNSYVNGAITNSCDFTKSFNVSNNKRIGSVTSTGSGNTGKYVISDNSHIAGGVALICSGSTSTASVEIRGNALIEGVTRVDGANNVVMNDNNTERRLTIEDVQNFQVVGNTAKTDTGEPCIWINPTTASNILAGVVTGNNCLIKLVDVNGSLVPTPGATYVTLASGVTNVMEGLNNKLAIAWS